MGVIWFFSHSMPSRRKTKSPLKLKKFLISGGSPDDITRSRPLIVSQMSKLSKFLNSPAGHERYSEITAKCLDTLFKLAYHCERGIGELVALKRSMLERMQTSGADYFLLTADDGSKNIVQIQKVPDTLLPCAFSALEEWLSIRDQGITKGIHLFPKCKLKTTPNKTYYEWIPAEHVSVYSIETILKELLVLSGITAVVEQSERVSYGSFYSPSYVEPEATADSSISRSMESQMRDMLINLNTLPNQTQQFRAAQTKKLRDLAAQIDSFSKGNAPT